MQENIDLLCKELRTPKYGAYFIYFTNRIDRGSIEKLALSDDQESVREVKVRERRKREREGGRERMIVKEEWVREGGLFDFLLGVLC